MRKEGGWVFISHSHLDIEVVRKIRNQLEECGFEPLMFYLKCLTDDNEIESLIQKTSSCKKDFLVFDPLEMPLGCNISQHLQNALDETVCRLSKI